MSPTGVTCTTFPLNPYYNHCAHPCHPQQEPFQIENFLHTLMYRRSLNLDERAPLGVASIAINSIFVGLAALALSIRFISRAIQGLELSFNDYAVLVAWVWSSDTHYHGTNTFELTMKKASHSRSSCDVMCSR